MYVFIFMYVPAYVYVCMYARGHDVHIIPKHAKLSNRSWGTLIMHWKYTSQDAPSHLQSEIKPSSFEIQGKRPWLYRLINTDYSAKNGRERSRGVSHSNNRGCRIAFDPTRACINGRSRSHKPINCRPSRRVRLVLGRTALTSHPFSLDPPKAQLW